MENQDIVQKSLRPYVLVYVTSSADGKIASRSRDSRLSCPYDLARLHGFRAWADAVIVGANTVIIDNPLLTVRRCTGKNPVRVVIDGRLRIPVNARICTDKSAKTLIFTSDRVSNDRVREFMNKGINVIKLRPKYGDYGLSPKDILLKLSELGISKVLVEGGSELLWFFFSEGVVDEFRITISPYIVGGRDAITIVSGKGFSDKDEWLKLKLLSVRLCECGNEVHLIYTIK